MDKKNNIKLQILDSAGTKLHEIETSYSSDQIDMFLRQNRIIIFSDEELVHFVSQKQWNSLNESKECLKEEILDIINSENTGHSHQKRLMEIEDLLLKQNKDVQKKR